MLIPPSFELSTEMYTRKDLKNTNLLLKMPFGWYNRTRGERIVWIELK